MENGDGDGPCVQTYKHRHSFVKKLLWRIGRRIKFCDLSFETIYGPLYLANMRLLVVMEMRW